MKAILLAVGGVFVVILVVFFIMWMSYSNGESRTRNQIVAKQRDNQNQLDNTIKVISQNAQVTEAQKEAFKDIIVGNAQARHQNGGSLATVVHEAVPNLDTTSQTYRQLMNIITAARNGWTDKQTQILDLQREHDNYFDTQPSRFFVHTLGGRDKMDRVQIVTSTRTGTAFQTGVDDDDAVFQKK
jgi:hypothetical protein